ncbi:MAG: hypothetical protein HOV80_20405 [Polyangiaceae bacterium]|nr:hypothetical protein [Polyangiaceae bacterium]
MTQKNITREDTGHEMRTGLGDTAKEAAGHIASDARAELDARVAGKKQRAGDELSSVADALRDTSDDLRERVPMVGDYAERAADTIDDLASFLRDKSPGEIIDDVQRFARREPALFFGGAFALGMVAARFLKSSAPRQTRSSEETSQEPEPEETEPALTDPGLPEEWGAV